MCDGADFNDAALVRLHQLGGESLLRQMINLFLDNVPQRIENIRVGIRENNLQAVGRAAHSLKSTAGNVGAIKLQALAQEIERCAECQDNCRVATMLDILQAAFAQTAVYLKQQSKTLVDL